jgi:flagellar biosynthesis chaperone FliJ
MAKLHSLIRFKRHQLDEFRRILSDLNTQLEVLYASKKKLLDDLAHEKNLAAVDIEASRNFGAYLNRMLREQEVLEEKIRKKSLEVQAATKVVQEAYLEAKKVEVTQENRDRAEEARLNKIDSDIMDEIGIENFRRKDDGLI